MEKNGFQTRKKIKYVKNGFLVTLTVALFLRGMYWEYVAGIVFSVWVQDCGIIHNIPYGDYMDQFPKNTYLTIRRCKWLFWYIYGDNVDSLPRQIIIGTYIRGITFLLHSIYIVVVVLGALRGSESVECVNIAIVSYLSRPVIIGMILEIIGIVTVFIYKFKRPNIYNIKCMAGRFLSMDWREKEPNAILLGTCSILEITHRGHKQYAKIQMKADNKIYKSVLLEKDKERTVGDMAELYEICKVQYLI